MYGSTGVDTVRGASVSGHTLISVTRAAPPLAEKRPGVAERDGQRMAIPVDQVGAGQVGVLVRAQIPLAGVVAPIEQVEQVRPGAVPQQHAVASVDIVAARPPEVRHLPLCAVATGETRHRCTHNMRDRARHRNSGLRSPSGAGGAAAGPAQRCSVCGSEFRRGHRTRRVQAWNNVIWSSTRG